MFFKKKKLIGLDIGSSSIKLAELDVSRKGASLIAFGMIPTPADATANGDITDPAAVAMAIRELVSEVKTKRVHAAAGLWGSSVVVKRVSIPQMDENLVAEQIRWEAEQYIPFEMSEVNLEFKILKRDGPQAETMEILLVAAVQSMIFKCVEMVESAGLTCDVLDVEGFALANCYENNYGKVQGETIGLLNVGASVTNFVVVEAGEVVFCRDIPIGGANYSVEIQKALNMSLSEAESMKLSASLGQAAPEEVGQVIQATHEMIVEEIASSIDFFLNTSQSSKVHRLFLSGGGMKTPGLFAALSKTHPCERFNPFVGVSVQGKSFTKAYIEQIRDFAAIAIGLGLRGFSES